jgi:hypothetical protein
MDFYAVLDQVIDLLRHRGRVTYGALQLQFGLTAAQLAVVKEELIDAQRLAHDEQGRILVWTGEADVAPASPPPAIPSTPEAERRQLTVMFCDLVESTKLASQLERIRISFFENPLSCPSLQRETRADGSV